MELGFASPHYGKEITASTLGLGKNRRESGKVTTKAQVQYLVSLNVLEILIVKHKLFYGPTGGKNSNTLGTLFYNGKGS